MAVQVKVDKVTPSNVLEAFASTFDVPLEHLECAVATPPRRNQKVGPARRSPRQLLALVDIYYHLLKTFSSVESASQWLADPDLYLQGATPLEVLRSGRIDRIEGALTGFDFGVFV